MKRMVSILTAVVCVGTAVAFTGCGGEVVPEGRVGIEFWYEADMNTNSTYYELVKTYNDTQGVGGRRVRLSHDDLGRRR